MRLTKSSVCRLKNLESDAEPEQTTVEAVRRLQCHIQNETTLMHHALLGVQLG